MQRFIFHVEDGPEDVAVLLDSLAEAKCEAVRYAGRLICDVADSFWNTADFHMWVSNPEGLILFSLRISGNDSPAIGTYYRPPS